MFIRVSANDFNDNFNSDFNPFNPMEINLCKYEIFTIFTKILFNLFYLNITQNKK